MIAAIDYSDCHVKAYVDYVRRTSASATPGGPQTLRFADWFQAEYHALPGFYIGINYLPRLQTQSQDQTTETFH